MAKQSKRKSDIFKHRFRIDKVIFGHFALAILPLFVYLVAVNADLENKDVMFKHCFQMSSIVRQGAHVKISLKMINR